MSFEEELEARAKAAGALIESYLPAEEGFAKTLIAAGNYSIRAGGKRIRPILMSLSYEMTGGKDRAVEPFMAAMEMIHTHSLIHDDLPAMDNDEYRRGRKTTHIVYGEAMAILAGDSLLNLAYETALEAFALRPTGEHIPRALQILAQKSGYRGMMGGQSVDVETEGTSPDEETLAYIYENKTAALIEASLMIGAALSGAGEETIRAMERAGSDIGLAFQIQDDLLDVEGDPALLGKSTGSDERNQKQTYVTLHGIKNARETVERLSRRAQETIRGAGGEHAFLLQLIEWMIRREK